MIPNDVLRRLRYALDLRDSAVAEIAGKGGAEITAKDVQSFLVREHEEGYQLCSDEILTSFLDGLIIDQRGERESQPGASAPTTIVANTNNRILRKLRIAFDLKDEGMLALLTAGAAGGESEFRISKSELSALFRKEGHRHYRECGDQVLRYFIIGITKERRGEDDKTPI